MPGGWITVRIISVKAKLYFRFLYPGSKMASRSKAEWVCCGLLFGAALAVLHGSANEKAPAFANYIDIGQKAGLTAKTIIGEENVKKYILESTGGGVAVIDYNNDG